MTYRAVSCNAMKPAVAARNHRIINNAAKRADILLVQEGNDPPIQAAMKALPGFDVFIPTGPSVEDPIAWRTSVLRPFGPKGCRTIMAQNPKVKDGPSRGAAWVGVEEIATGKRVIHVNTHLIHQAFTKHRERQGAWAASLANLGLLVHDLTLSWPGVPIVINADWNNPNAFDIPHISEDEAPSPATYGKVRYDRFLRVGGVSVENTDDFAVESDHDSLYAEIRVWGSTPTRPPVVTPKPVPKPAPKPTPAKPKPTPAPVVVAPVVVPDDQDWTTLIDRWAPDSDVAGDRLKAGQQLNQARGFAEAAYESARRTDTMVEAIAQGLGPAVAAAARKALVDSLVSVSVSVGTSPVDS